MDDYESYVRAELDAARAKIADMERALDVYLAWRNRGQTITVTHPARVKLSPDTAKVSNAPRQRASKNDAIFAAFNAAGNNGLSQEDVQRIARENGINSNPNALRALCWTAKERGRLISLAPGRYAIAPKNEAAVENLSEGETAAPH